jgi:hypothetical protein
MSGTLSMSGEGRSPATGEVVLCLLLSILATVGALRRGEVSPCLPHPLYGEGSEHREPVAALAYHRHFGEAPYPFTIYLSCIGVRGASAQASSDQIRRLLLA